MSMETPQTPRPLRKIRNMRSPAHKDDSASDVCWNNLDIEGVPELTRTRTPSADRSFPPTPNDSSTIGQPILFGSSDSPLSKVSGGTQDVKSELAHESQSSINVPATSDPVKLESRHARPARRLFRNTNQMFSQDGEQHVEKKSIKPIATVKLDASVMRFNFSQLSPIHDEAKTRLFSGLHREATAVVDVAFKKERIMDKHESELRAGELQLDEHSDQPPISTIILSTIQANGGQPMSSTNAPTTRQSWPESKHRRDYGVIRVGSTKVDLVKILPYDTPQRLRDDASHCISSKANDPSSRCKHKLKRTPRDTENLLTTLEGLRAFNMRTAIPHIQFVINNATCNQGKHRKLANAEVEQLLNCLSEHSNGSSRSSKCFAGLAALNYWITALTDPAVSRVDHAASVDQQSLAKPQSASRSPAVRENDMDQTFIESEMNKQSIRSEQCSANGTKLLDSCRQNRVLPLPVSIDTAIGQGFRQYTIKKRNGRSIGQILRDELIRPLTPKNDLKEGYIYIYWTRGNFGYVKIGVTARSIEARMNEWVERCGHEIESHSLLGSDSDSGLDHLASVKIPHVYRVERLVHAELYREQLEETKCRKCGTTHKEWFRVSPEAAKKVVLKWSRWMRERRPYEPQDATTAADIDLTATRISTDRSQPARSTDRTTQPSRAQTPKSKPKVSGSPLSPFITEDEIREICQPIATTQTSPGTTSTFTRRRSRTVSLRTARPTRRSPRRSSGTVQMDLDFNLPSIFEASG